MNEVFGGQRSVSEGEHRGWMARITAALESIADALLVGTSRIKVDPFLCDGTLNQTVTLTEAAKASDESNVALWVDGSMQTPATHYTYNAATNKLTLLGVSPTGVYMLALYSY